MNWNVQHTLYELMLSEWGLQNTCHRQFSYKLWGKDYTFERNTMKNQHQTVVEIKYVHSDNTHTHTHHKVGKWKSFLIAGVIIIICFLFHDIFFVFFFFLGGTAEALVGLVATNPTGSTYYIMMVWIAATTLCVIVETAIWWQGHIIFMEWTLCFPADIYNYRLVCMYILE